MKNNKGISLVEVLIVITIFLAMALLSTNAYRDWQKQVQLVNGASEFREILMQAQQLSVAAAENSSWGVHIDTGEYVLFKGSFYNQSDPNNKFRDFRGIYIDNASSSISDGVGGYTSDIVFSKYIGDTVNTGSIALKTIFNQNVEKLIIIESSGKINYD